MPRESELRTRLIIAATRFANEIADAIEEATGQREAIHITQPRKQRRVVQRPPAGGDTPVTAEALAKADEILERSGYGRRKR